MTLTGLGFLLFVGAGIAGLAAKARREHHDMLRQRAALLDAAASLFAEARIAIGHDGFPVLTGRLLDGRPIGLEVIADTLVPRRLPQLWFKLTIHEPTARCRPSIGVLARPTGAEFYSLVQELPDWIAPPFRAEIPLLMRGRDASGSDVEQTSAVFARLFSDPGLKEAAVTPRGVRLVRQIAQGERGAHMVYRQIRFPVLQVSPDLVRKALEEAELLNTALDSRSVRAVEELV
jgi:hypothetical protein